MATGMAAKTVVRQTASELRRRAAAVANLRESMADPNWQTPEQQEWARRRIAEDLNHIDFLTKALREQLGMEQ